MEDEVDLSITDRDYDNPWTYGGVRFSLSDAELEKFVGFVYVIQCLAPENFGKKYIGKKTLWTPKVRQKTNPKTKVKRKIRSKVESDWKEYYGSSLDLQADVEKYGRENFSREILHLCKTKGMMGYLEAKEQFDRNALIREDYYNRWIMVRVRADHLREAINDHVNRSQKE